MSLIKKKVFEIKSAVDSHSASITDNYGLLSGLAGEILFLYYFEKIYGKQEYQNIISKIDILLKSIRRYKSTPAFCSGMSGVFYLTELLKKDSIINIELGKNIVLYLDKVVNYYISKNKYEFLYGLTGISQYLLMEPEDYREQLVKIADYFDKSKLIINDTYAWEKTTATGNEIDLAISHGISSIIVFLSKLLDLDLPLSRRIVIKDMLNKSIEFILSQQNHLSEEIYSYYPYSCHANEKQDCNSRLAWCYGDLSIGITLFNAGKACKNTELTSYAEKILLNAAINRRDQNLNLVQDPGLCHGASGISAIFYRMWWNTHNLKYLDAALYWTEIAMQMSKYQNGIAGYVYKSANSYRVGTHLLEGVSGIGISMMFLDTRQEPVWDKCLMIS